MKKRLFPMLAILVCLSLVMSCGGGQEEQKTETAQAPKNRFVTIGTGDITGVYYPTGGAIAKIVNQEKDRYGIRCTVEATGGSAFNINAVMAGDLQFGVVQSDRQFQAWNGSPNSDWTEKGPQKDLRACFSIHPESVTLVAAVDAGIESILDLKGKHVNIGNPGSGHRRNAIDALDAVGLNYETDLQAEGFQAGESAGLLQDGRIDAFFYTAGHPNGSIREAAAGRRKVRLAAITGVETLLAGHPYYAKTVIPVDLYPGAVNEHDVETFGVKATLITSIQVPDDVVYAVTREVFENLEAFKSLHPAYRVLTRKNMLEGLSAPFHPGAEKYFREAGLL